MSLMYVFVRYLPILILTILLSVPAASQSRHEISGKVLDSSGAGIAGATVTTRSINDAATSSTTTDRRGGFSIRIFTAERCVLNVSAPGFSPFSETIDPSALPSLNVTLAPGTLEDSVTVTAAKGAIRQTSDTAQPVTVSSPAGIEQRRPASPYQAIERTPNLIQAGGNFAIERPRLRGLAASRVLIVIDGERLNNVRTDSGSTGLSPSVVDITQLDSIEVLSSADSSLYGSDSLAGTINLITRHPLRSQDGNVLGIRFESDARTNDRLRRAAGVINWSSPRLALRLAGSLFRSGDYKTGNSDITQTEVVRLGRFATDMGNTLVGQSLGPIANLARTYAVWSLPAGGRVANGQSHGGNGQVDVWLFPFPAQSIRYRQLNSQHYNVGQAFSTPPFDPFLSRSSFRRLDKYGARYEAHDMLAKVAHLSGGFYWQKYSAPQDQVATNIPNASLVNGNSSWATQTIADPVVTGRTIDLGVLTGNTSQFQYANATSNQNKNTIASVGLDVQGTFVPLENMLLTTGIGYLRDRSRDEFARFTYSSTNQPTNFTAGATTPNSDYRNLGWFNLIEYSPLRWLHLTGGWRVDRWQTEAVPTTGFPLGSEAAILNASIGNLKANPGPLNVAGIDGALGLVSGTGKLTTDNTIVTGSAGIVFRSKSGVNPYIRLSNSYREPEITTRYIVRDFGSPAYSVLLVSNTGLKPERGRNIEAGVKVNRSHWYLTATAFRNDLTDFIRSVTSPVYYVAPDAARGLLPLYPGGPHGVQYAQRINAARARIEGVESTFGFTFSLGRFGSLTPFGTMGYLKGTDLSPQENALILIERFYNTATPVPLSGSKDDVPLQNITPFKAVWGATYLDRKGSWFAEYQVRRQSRVERVDPLDVTALNTTQYGTFASLAPFATQSVRLGYKVQTRNLRFALNLGVENLTNRLYFEQFQTAPAPGRSIVFGITTEFLNLLRR